MRATTRTSPPADTAEQRPLEVVVSVQHPAHAHFYRYVVRDLQRLGHDVHVFARDTPIIRTLLDTFGVEYEALCDPQGDGGPPGSGQLRYELALLRRSWRIGPDVMSAIGGVAVSHVASLVGARSVVFTDTEHATLSNALAFPFADTICTPDCYRDNIGDKQERYAGYHELAYLHPNRFTPDPSVFDELDVSAGDSFVVLRSVGWDAKHDDGEGGFDDVVDAVARIEECGSDVLITAEGDLPDAVADRQTDIRPHEIHDLLSYADLFIGEGATMAVESAVLGTPAVYVNTLDTGLTDELAERYGLLFRYHDDDRHADALQTAVALLEDRDDHEWERRRAELLADKRDTLDVAVTKLLDAGSES